VTENHLARLCLLGDDHLGVEQYKGQTFKRQHAGREKWTM